MTILTLMTILVLACVVFFSSKAGGVLLTACIEQSATPIDAPAGKAAQAIVVLTGGDLRTQEAARQYRQTGLPVLTSGGDGEAARIKEQLETEFHVPVKWTEENSLNTEQNAMFSAEILAKENIQSIILVTHALHMRRARMMFLDQGLDVIPAATDYTSHTALEWRDFLPSAEGRKLTQSALHEIVGLAWFRIRQIVA
ncbi:YdcF family protein [Polaromonas vacuolata]|nr:YdcF family protein [Polaromonas vacuolata]